MKRLNSLLFGMMSMVIRPYVSHPLKNIAHTPEEANRFILRHREQLHELLTKYGKIDIICLDMSLGAEVWLQFIKNKLYLIKS
jgi:hypothetical protein